MQWKYAVKICFICNICRRLYIAYLNLYALPTLLMFPVTIVYWICQTTSLRSSRDGHATELSPARCHAAVRRRRAANIIKGSKRIKIIFLISDPQVQQWWPAIATGVPPCRQRQAKLVPCFDCFAYFESYHIADKLRRICQTWWNFIITLPPRSQHGQAKLVQCVSCFPYFES